MPADLRRAGSKTFEIPLPIKVDSLTEIMRIRGVGVYVHWSVLLVCIFILLNVIRHPLPSLMGLAAYIAVLLIHESGHMIAAQHLHCRVFTIELYPLFGFCKFEAPWSKFDHCVIAWSGVLAQMVVAVPIVIYLVLAGYTRFNSVNAVLVLLSFFSLAVAIFNLLPVAPLDGAMAWRIIPEGVKRIRLRSIETRTWKH